MGSALSASGTVGVLIILHEDVWNYNDMGVSLNGGTPKSSILIGFSIINHPFWGTTILGNPHMNGIQ